MIAATTSLHQRTAEPSGATTPTSAPAAPSTDDATRTDRFEPTPAEVLGNGFDRLTQLLSKQAGKVHKSLTERPDEAFGGAVERGLRTPQDTTQQRAERLAKIDSHHPSEADLAGKSFIQRALVYMRFASERSEQFATIATELEADPNADADQLEQAQQGAKSHRISEMQRELKQTAAGRRVLEYHQREGTKLTVLTDREWQAAGHKDSTLAFANGDGLTMKVRHMTDQIFIHEMTHTIDDRENTFRNDMIDRLPGVGAASARQRYEDAGLDPDEGQAAWEVAHDATEYGAHVKTHAHTRMAEARYHRELNGGTDFTIEEMREVMRLSLPRENMIQVRNQLTDKDAGNDATALESARALGISTDGKSVEQVAEELQRRADSLEQQIVAIEQRR